MMQRGAKPAESSFSSSVWMFFGLAFAFSWILWTVARAFDNHMVIIWVGVWGPAVAGVAVTFRAEGRAGVRHLAGRLVAPTGARWLAIALLTPPTLFLAGTYLHADVFSKADWIDPQIPWNLVPLHLVGGLLLGPMQEEPGWRGVALPLLERRFRALAASLLLGVAWGVWHLPLFLFAEGGQSDMNPVVFIASTTALSVFYTWIVNRAGGSLLPALVMHASSNTASAVLLATPSNVGDQGPFVASVLVMVAGAMILSLVFSGIQRR